MREALGEVAKERAVCRNSLLRIEAEIVALRQKALEQRLRLDRPSNHEEGVDEPKATDQEGAFAAGNPVGGTIPQDIVAHTQAFLDRFDGAREELRRERGSELGRQQERGIGLPIAERLRQAPPVGIEFSKIACSTASLSACQTSFGPRRRIARSSATQPMSFPWT